MDLGKRDPCSAFVRQLQILGLAVVFLFSGLTQATVYSGSDAAAANVSEPLPRLRPPLDEEITLQVGREKLRVARGFLFLFPDPSPFLLPSPSPLLYNWINYGRAPRQIELGSLSFVFSMPDGQYPDCGTTFKEFLQCRIEVRTDGDSAGYRVRNWVSLPHEEPTEDNSTLLRDSEILKGKGRISAKFTRENSDLDLLEYSLWAPELSKTSEYFFDDGDLMANFSCVWESNCGAEFWRRSNNTVWRSVFPGEQLPHWKEIASTAERLIAGWISKAGANE